MVLNVALRRISPALRLLLWSLLGAALVQVVLQRQGPDNPHHFSPIFWFLLDAYDSHGNALLLAVAVLAFLCRRRPEALALVDFAAAHPWRLAAGAFVLFGLGALQVYRAYPLSMDEYAALFQAQAFAAGRLTGQFPPDLLDALLPRFPPGYFLTASKATGAVSGTYWPGFALLLAPFAWLGIPWALNPAISALTLPALHRLAAAISGSRAAAGWTVLLALASPVFVVDAMSYYSMPAHLLCGVLYALLLLRPTAARALLAGFVGSVALVLHNPVPHLLFAPAFVAWLLYRRTPVSVFAALLAGYLPLVLIAGFGWQQHLDALLAAAPTAARAPAAATAVPLLDRMWAQVATLVTLPRPLIIEARIAGLSKVWTWAAAGLMVLAAQGYASARAHAMVRVLGAALLATFFGYFLVPVDQGHGWGYRYLHSAWFVLPLFAGLALGRDDADRDLRGMAAWAVALSLVLASALRLAQVDVFMRQHLDQVPPLAAPADPAHPEILFVYPDAGFYMRDMVHNDPLLRSPRVMMVFDGADKSAALMARRFPAYTKSAEGDWGELWKK